MPASVFNGLKLTTGFIENVSTEWQTVHLPHTYARMIVACNALQDGTANTAVVRLDDALNGNSFRVRLESPSGANIAPAHVTFVAAEEGYFHDPATGVKVEARQTPMGHSTQDGQAYTFQQTYANPVIIGSVMTSDHGWSVFFSKELTSATARVGYHTGADPSGPRGGERIGFLVFEAGEGNINGIRFSAGKTTGPVLDVTEGKNLVSVGVAATSAICSSSSLVGADGAWPTLWGPGHGNAIGEDQIAFTLMEDGFGANRIHSDDEVVSYVAFNAHNEASRFLVQAGFGGSVQELESVARLGIANWIRTQKDTSVSRVRPYLDDITKYSVPLANAGVTPDVPWVWRDVALGIDGMNISSQWMRNVLRGHDQLRQRMAFALSQILVVSYETRLEDRRRGRAFADYYDTIAEHALGNYRDLLAAVTYHPVMGEYLTYLSNLPASEDGLRQPDENYAREIMQLFSIGLWDLNNDGSIKTSGGEQVPAYTSADIAELARVFTGMWFSNTPFQVADAHIVRWALNGTPGGVGAFQVQDLVNLAVFDEFHDHGSKQLFADKPWRTTFPAGQGGHADVEQAIDTLFNHPNTPPFVARRLIQFLVASNPSPSFISDIANVFQNNGAGVRGDLFSVAQAILLHPEAREYPTASNPQRGKLVEPVVRFTRLMKSLNMGSDLSPDDFSNPNAPIYNDLIFEHFKIGGQGPLRSNSVFNFFQPDFRNGQGLSHNGQNLFSPEFQILDAVSATEFANYITLVFSTLNDTGSVLWNPHPAAPVVGLDFSPIRSRVEAGDIIGAVDLVDTMLAGGQLTEAAKSTIIGAVGTNISGQTSINKFVNVLTWSVTMSPESAVVA